MQLCESETFIWYVEERSRDWKINMSRNICEVGMIARVRNEVVPVGCDTEVMW